MKTTDIALDLNETFSVKNRAAVNRLVNELKHNGAKLFSATVSDTGVVFAVEPKVKRKFLISYFFSDKEGNGQARVFVESNGGVTQDWIEKTERMIESEELFDSVIVTSIQEIEVD